MYIISFQMDFLESKRGDVLRNYSDEVDYSELVDSLLAAPTKCMTMCPANYPIFVYYLHFLVPCIIAIQYTGDRETLHT